MRTRLKRHGLLLAAALIAVTGCDVGREAKAEVSYMPRPNLPARAFRVRVDDGRSTRTFRGDEMTRPYSSSQVSTAVIETATSGTLTIEYALEISNAIVSEGVVTLALRDDWIWGARVEVDSIDPTRYCFGCFGSKAFPLAAAYRRVPADSVWVTWGGNSIKNPGIY